MNSETVRTEFEIHSKLGKITAPTLTIVGKQDPRDKLNDAAAAAGRLPNGKVIAYYRCGHWPHIEHPDDFNDDVTRFLSA